MAKRFHRAFTLIELLMVVAIIGILVSLVAGGLTQAKARAHRITCLNNQRELHTVWHKFADDNDDRLVVNSNPIGNISPVTTNVPWPPAGCTNSTPPSRMRCFSPTRSIRPLLMRGLTRGFTAAVPSSTRFKAGR